MTNRHCGTCGDPLFRYEGNEFCATCEGRADEAETQEEPTTDGTTEEPTTGAAPDGTAGSTAESTTPEDADADAAGHPSPADIPGGEGTGSAASNDARRTGSTPATPSVPSGSTAGTTPSASTGAPATDTHAEGDGDLETARAALVRTLTAHAQRAEAADGPRRAVDHLTAVREAAEALAALDETRR